VQTKIKMLSIGIAIAQALTYSTSSPAYLLPQYTPITKTDMSHQVPIKFVPADNLVGEVNSPNPNIHIADCNMHVSSDPHRSELLFTGKDKNNKPWVLAKAYYPTGTIFFTADLDKNGMTDIIVLQTTGSCGRAPSTVLTLILFDKEACPFPVELFGYSNTDEKTWAGEKINTTIDDLITLGNDPRTCVISQQAGLTKVKGKPFAIRYWKTIVYRAEDSRLKKLDSYKGQSFPLIALDRDNNNASYKTTLPTIKAQSHVDNISCTLADEAGCRNGNVQEVSLDEFGIVEKLKLSSGEFTPYGDPDGDRSAETFVISETKDLYQIASYRSSLAGTILQKAAQNKAKIKFMPRTLRSTIPAYIWISDPAP
jgi:hypothetical protein